VVLQFFIVPLGLVAVLVSVFFGLQVLRSRHPDPLATLGRLKGPSRFLLPWAGDPKRWQSGYDLSLLVRSGPGDGAEALIPELAAAFKDAGGDLKLRRYLALALGRSGDGRAGPALREGLQDPDDATRLFCAWGLMQIADRSALPELRAAAADPDPGVRTMAVFALGQMGDREGAGALKTALGDAAIGVRWNAALSLARLGDASGEAVLIGILDGGEAGTGQVTGTGQTTGTGQATGTEGAGDAAAPLNAIRALALLKDDAARTALKRATESGQTEEIRGAARLALEAITAEGRNRLP
jgi:HEAT repeat protein